MKQPLFPSAIGTQSRFAYFLTVKAVVRKFGKSNGQTGSWCLDKAVLAQGGGGGYVPGSVRIAHDNQVLVTSLPRIRTGEKQALLWTRRCTTMVASLGIELDVPGYTASTLTTGTLGHGL